jgi:hypothetical protein
MIDAGILPGDVVVEKRQFANDGEMVVTTVDNEFTLKTLAKKRANSCCSRPRRTRSSVRRGSWKYSGCSLVLPKLPNLLKAPISRLFLLGLFIGQ